MKDEILYVPDVAELLYGDRKKTRGIYHKVLRGHLPYRKPTGKKGQTVFLRSEIMSFIQKAPGLRPDEIK